MGGHDHHEHSIESTSKSSRRALAIALSITLSMMVIEIVGGLISNSLALLGDAGHMLTDTAALALSFFAVGFALRPPTKSKTFGFYRAEILAALVNVSVLLLVCGYIFY